MNFCEKTKAPLEIRSFNILRQNLINTIATESLTINHVAIASDVPTIAVENILSGKAIFAGHFQKLSIWLLYRKENDL